MILKDLQDPTIFESFLRFFSQKSQKGRKGLGWGIFGGKISDRVKGKGVSGFARSVFGKNLRFLPGPEIFRVGTLYGSKIPGQNGPPRFGWSRPFWPTLLDFFARADLVHIFVLGQFGELLYQI